MPVSTSITATATRASLFVFRHIKLSKLVLPTWSEAGHGMLEVLCAFCAIMLFIIPLGFSLPRPDGRAFLVLSGQLNSLNGIEFALGICAVLFSAKTVLFFFIAAFGIALPEEFIFRGVLQSAIARRTKRPVVALIVTSFLFGIAHLKFSAISIDPAGWNWTFLLLATIAGIGYGSVFMRTSSLAFPIILHALVVVVWRTCLS